MEKIKYKNLITGEETTYHVNDKFMISIEELKDKYGLNFDGMSDEEILKECDKWYEEYVKTKGSMRPLNRKERRANK